MNRLSKSSARPIELSVARRRVLNLRWPRGLLVLAAALSLATGVGCGCGGPDKTAPVAPPTTAAVGQLPVESLRLKNKTVRLEVRSTPAARLTAIGQFPVPSTADGVLLVHPIARPAHMYYYGAPMKLEIVVLDDAGKILAVENVIPEGAQQAGGLAEYFGNTAGPYALVLPGGMFRESGAQVGDTLSIPPAAAQAAKAGLTSVNIKGHTFHLEVAATDVMRRQGLMRVPALPADVGMAFVFTSASRLGFWMRNTLIPLDIAYLDEQGTVVSVHALQPFNENQVTSARPAKYALELQRGTAARIGLLPGDRIALPAAITQPSDLE